MSQNKILRCLERVDGRFLTELAGEEKEEAVQEFKRLWSEQKEKVSAMLNRKQRAHFNKETQEKQLSAQAKQIAVDLRNRVEKHTKKRSVLQLQKLKSYRNMDRDWKDRVTQITINLRKEEIKKFEKAKELSREIQQFWQNKRSNQSSPRRSSRQSQEFSPKRSDFITEIVSKKTPTIKERRNAKSEIEVQDLPDLHSRVKGGVSASRSLNIQRRKTEGVDPHLVRWNHQLKQREDTCFQKAMQKIDIILKKRTKTREALFEHSRKAREGRQLKQNIYFNKQKRYQSERDSHSLHIERHRVNDKKVEQRRSTALMPYYDPEMDMRRRQLQEENYRLRSEILGRERLKERRGKFHRMVRDAVKLCRVQTLKGKS